LFYWPANDYENLLGLAMHQNETGMVDGLFKAWDNPTYNKFKLMRRFENAVPLHYYAVFKPHLLRRMFDLIRDRPKVLVGSFWTNNMVKMLGNFTPVRIPNLDAYDTIDLWYPELEKHDLILFAAGPSKCAASLRLLKSGRQVQVLDLGSLVDLAAAIPSRTWIRMTPIEARKVLLGE